MILVISKNLSAENAMSCNEIVSFRDCCNRIDTIKYMYVTIVDNRIINRIYSNC
ncbi:hypothetical protein LAD12857_18490 [Lacrimispora amygdalina]|uniref:Uncharacterized protein n=1 Tax=Lacrimispora amygdalina TaxID=253257 RepID=A0ABQ5M5W6_9FIRM